MVDAVIVGAGIAGLVAGRDLQAAGLAVVLVEAGPRPGGRLATRTIGRAAFDDGAQFFTVRSPWFRDRVTAWSAGGCPIQVWGHGLARVRHVADGPAAADTSGDGYPRYVVAGGMAALASHLARGLDVRLGFPVGDLTPADGRWRIRSADGTVLTADAVMLTPPVPQSLAIVDAGDATLPAPTRLALHAVRYEPCLSLLVAADRPLYLPAPGGVQFADGPVRVLSDNMNKGTSPEPALTVHLRGDVSRARFDDPSAAVAADVLAWVKLWLAGASVIDWHLSRWRFAEPTRLHEDRTAACEVDGSPLLFAGDAFVEAKVEGAARSGLSAAQALLATA